MFRAARRLLASTRRLAAPALLAVGFAGCLSPTLPLPPPDPPDYMAASASEPGVWRIGGSVTPGALVLIRNERTGIVVGTEDADGSYLVTMDAERCDTASVFEVDGTHASDASYFIVRETVNGVPQDAPCVAAP